jgi:hypothetical protein
MRQMKLIGITFLFICLFACGQTNQKNASSVVPDNWKAIDETGYMIQYPDSFDLDTSGQMGMSFILLSRPISGQDLFRENLNLMIQDLGGQNINLDKFVEISEGQIKTMMTNGIITESKRNKAGNSEFQKIIYTGTQGQFNLKFEQYYWIVKGKAFVLTLTCELSQFDKYKAVGEKIMNSFKIK